MTLDLSFNASDDGVSHDLSDEHAATAKAQAPRSAQIAPPRPSPALTAFIEARRSRDAKEDVCNLWGDRIGQWRNCRM